MWYQEKVKESISLFLNQGFVNYCSRSWVHVVIMALTKESMMDVPVNKCVNDLGFVTLCVIL
jgi:hypothetical protein